MRVGEADSTIDNALSMSRLFGLDAEQAIKEARGVARVVDQWKQHFKAAGVLPREIDLYAEQIDRPFSREQRTALLR